MLGRGGALVGLAVTVVLAAGGVGAAVAVQPQAQPVPAQAPEAGTRVVTVLDGPRVNVPEPTTTTTTAPPPQVVGSASAPITVIITRPVP